MRRLVGRATSAVNALIGAFTRITLALYVDFHIEGAERLPRSGPTVIASRHFHFLFDALALMRASPRPVHFWVAVDWTSARWQRLGMELLCRSADWPTMLRVDDYSIDRFSRGATAYALKEAEPMLRGAIRDALRLLDAGQTLVLFPEAYTNVDIFPTPKVGEGAFLPFRPGFVKLAQLAERRHGDAVTITPVGLCYERLSGPRNPAWLPFPCPMWRLTLRFGEPRSIAPHASQYDMVALVAQVEQEVHMLSQRQPEMRSR